MKRTKLTALFISIALDLTLMVGCGTTEPEAVPEPPAPAPPPADEPEADTAATVLTNGVIYTVDGANWDSSAAEAVAIDADGVIMFVGSAAEAEAYIGGGTEVIDLKGNIVFPGFIDGHCHTPGSAMTELYEIYLYEALVLDDTLAVIEEFISENPDFEEYWGYGYSVSIGGDPIGPKAEWLDEICADKPIILGSNDGHNLWLNSLALEMNGITPDSPVPAGGSAPVDAATGKMWGSLTDASSMVTMERSEYTEEEQLEAMAYFQESMHGWGYTSMMAIAPHDVDQEIFKTFEDNGDLSLRINIAGLMEPDGDIGEAISDTLAWKDSLKDSDLLKVSTMKYFADGVVEGMTGYLSEPYDEAAGLDPDYRAEFYWDPEALKGYFADTLEAGLQIHVHSIGDAATEETINAMEYAQGQYPDLDARNVITHLQLVHDADKARMAENDIIGSTQPFWHLKEPDWYEYVDLIALGEDRAYNEYPVKSLIDAGVLVTFSGDHPVSPVNNPFYAIEVAVTRNLYDPEFYGVDPITDIDDPEYLLNPAERITMKQAIEAYTINAAYQLFSEDSVGSIAAGKFADLIVLDRDIFDVDPVKIYEVEVLATIFNGDVVYGEL
jgi:predicted amidohydrolase YtcJ